MVEETNDSTYTKYGIAYAESGHPVLEPAKKSELKFSHNENSMTESKSIGSPLRMENNGRPREISENKNHTSARMFSPPKSNSGMGHKVYVRRRPETEKSHPSVDCPHSKKSNEQGETTREHAEMNEPMICTSDASPLSPSFYSVSSPGKILSPGNVNCVHIDSVNPSSTDPIIAKIKLWEERYRCLQSLLKILDRSGQEDYLKMLWSMSSVELSKHALELEKRSIRLSLEEARELQRMSLFDVLGKYQKNVGTTTTTTTTQQEMQQIHK